MPSAVALFRAAVEDYDVLKDLADGVITEEVAKSKLQLQVSSTAVLFAAVSSEPVDPSFFEIIMPQFTGNVKHNKGKTTSEVWLDNPGEYAKMLLDDLQIGELYLSLLSTRCTDEQIVTALMSQAMPMPNNDNEMLPDYLPFFFHNAVFECFNVMSAGNFATMCLRPEAKKEWFTRAVLSMKYHKNKFVDDSSRLEGGDMFFLQCKNGCCVVHDPANLLACTKLTADSRGNFPTPNGWSCSFCQVTEITRLRYSTIGHFIRSLDKNTKVFDATFLPSIAATSPSAGSSEKNFTSIFDGDAFQFLQTQLEAAGEPPLTGREAFIGIMTDGCIVGRNVTATPMQCKVFNGDLRADATFGVTDNIHVMSFMGACRNIQAVSGHAMAVVLELHALRTKGVNCASGFRRVFCLGTMQDLAAVYHSCGFAGASATHACERCIIPGHQVPVGKKTQASHGAEALREAGLPVPTEWSKSKDAPSFSQHLRDAAFMQELCEHIGTHSRAATSEALREAGFSKKIEESGQGGISAFWFIPYQMFPHYFVSQDLMHKIRNSFRHLIIPLYTAPTVATKKTNKKRPRGRKDAEAEAEAEQDQDNKKSLRLFGEPEVRRLARKLQNIIVPSHMDAPTIFVHERERSSHAQNDYTSAAIEKDVFCLYFPAIFLGVKMEDGMALDLYYCYSVLGWCIWNLSHDCFRDPLGVALLETIEKCLWRVFILISDYMEARGHAVPITIHGVVHLCESVRIWGPLRNLWVFASERYHQVVKRCRSSNKYILSSIAETHNHMKVLSSTVTRADTHLDGLLVHFDTHYANSLASGKNIVHVDEIPYGDIDWSKCTKAEQRTFFASRLPAMSDISGFFQSAASEEKVEVTVEMLLKSILKTKNLEVLNLRHLLDKDAASLLFFATLYRRDGVEELGSADSNVFHAVPYYSRKQTGRHTVGDQSIIRSCYVHVDFKEDGMFPAKILFFAILEVQIGPGRYRRIPLARVRFFDNWRGASDRKKPVKRDGEDLVAKCIYDAGLARTVRNGGINEYVGSLDAMPAKERLEAIEKKYKKFVTAAAKWSDICPVLDPKQSPTFPLTFPVCIGDASLHHEKYCASDIDMWVHATALVETICLVPCGRMPSNMSEHVWKASVRNGEQKHIFDDRRTYYAYLSPTTPFAPQS